MPGADINPFTSFVDWEVQDSGGLRDSITSFPNKGLLPNRKTNFFHSGRCLQTSYSA
nr:hypothetical protein [Tanacetum cinerariifolium]